MRIVRKIETMMREGDRNYDVCVCGCGIFM